MKKIIWSTVACLATWISYAQTATDVVNISGSNATGTARFMSMGGAFGALGGDMSAIRINPASLAVFNNTTATITGGFHSFDNSTYYFGTFNNSNESSIKLDQAGGVWIIHNPNPESKWRKMSVGFNYELRNNYRNEYFASGNGNASIDQFFVNSANGYVLDEVSALPGESISDAYYNIGSDSGLGYRALQGFLGYESYIIDPLTSDPDNTEYISNAIYGNSINQQYFVSNRGYNDEVNFNIGGQYGENLYLGASFIIANIDKERFTSIEESGFSSNSLIQNIYFENLLRTYGSSFTMSFGGIARVSQALRIGASYQTPTWYQLNDELTQYISTDILNSGSGTDFVEVDPRVTFAFPYYDITIPSKLTGSAALVFPNGLLSFDYGYQDMSNAKLRPASDSYFASENNYIANNLKAVSTYRLGGEYKIDRLSLRAGYRFEESPYVNGNTLGDLTAYSAGLGLAFGRSRIDCGFLESKREYNEGMMDGSVPTTVRNDLKTTNVTLSYSYNF